MPCQPNHNDAVVPLPVMPSVAHDTMQQPRSNATLGVDRERRGLRLKDEKAPRTPTPHQNTKNGASIQVK